MHELVPEVPLRHGHAISIDMAYSATLANQRGLLSDEEHRRLLNLFSRAGLSMDHHQFDEQILEKATQAILKTRDGLLRAAVPTPLGSCIFLSDVSKEEMAAALRRHKEIVKEFPRNGEGIEAFVDASDTGYTMNAVPVEKQTNGHANGSNGNGAVNGGLKKTLINDDAANGHANGHASGMNEAVKHAAGVDADSALTNGHANGYSNGVH
jgi:3-dehydroquinate synthase